MFSISDRRGPFCTLKGSALGEPCLYPQGSVHWGFWWLILTGCIVAHVPKSSKEAVVHVSAVILRACVVSSVTTSFGSLCILLMYLSPLLCQGGMYVAPYSVLSLKLANPSLFVLCDFFLASCSLFEGGREGLFNVHQGLGQR